MNRTPHARAVGSAKKHSRGESRLKHFAPALLVLALVVVGLLALSGSRADAAKNGELAFTIDSVDLGRVPLDKPASARFAMRNVGDKPVKILGKPKIAALEGC